MDRQEIHNIWRTYGNALDKKRVELEELYGVGICLMGRSVEFGILGVLVGILTMIVVVAL